MIGNLIAQHLPWCLGALALIVLAIACALRASVRGIALVLIATVLYVIFT